MINKFLIFMFLIITINIINAQEDIDNNIENHEPAENIQSDKKNIDNNNQKIGIIFSFSGFNEFRMGMGLFFGKLGSDGGHHPFGDDFGLLFEYNLKNNISYSRFYYHITGGVSAMLLGGSMVIVSDRDDISIGAAPEIGFGLSTIFKIFYRYNFYINNRFNSYEVVFQLCLNKIN